MFKEKWFTNDVSGDRHKGLVYDMMYGIYVYILAYMMIIFTLHLSAWAREEYVISAFFSPEIKTFYINIVKSRGLSVAVEFLAWLNSLVFLDWSNTPLLPLLPIPLYYALNVHYSNSNPWGKKKHLNQKGTGREATEGDIKKLGLFDGVITVLGKFKGKYMKLPETLSVLAAAPPGTGKTTAIIIPTLFNCDDVSIVVNDPKPELCFTTSGYRASVGPTFTLNWGAQNDPENGIYYPSWNALSPKLMPPQGPDRDMYIESMANVLIQDKKGSSSDPHWSNGGKNALNGLFHFLFSKFERAKASDYFYQRLKEGTFDSKDADVLSDYYIEIDDSFARGALKMLEEGRLDYQNYVPIGTWEGIPEKIRTNEPSIPILLDWMTESQLKAAEIIKKRQQGGDQSAMFADPMKDFFETAVAEAKKFKYSNRAILELNQLANTPDKERGSILSNAMMGIAIFKNSAVRERTSSTSFGFADLRGMIDPKDGKFKPLTVYLSVNVEYARALNKISGMFIELMSNFLIAHPPSSTFNGEEVGPCPVLFALDEFPQMPQLSALIDGPAVGRGQKVSYLLICQDLGQIEADYGRDAVETVMSTTAAKIILAQNNEKSAKRFADMIGNKTIVQGDTRHGDKKIDGFSLDVGKSLQSEKVFDAMDLMSLPFGEQVVLYQGAPDKPIKAESPLWFKDPVQVAKKEMPQAPFLPDWVLEREKLENSADAKLERPKKRMMLHA
ncbi:MAG: type IV secretory system conjugative DNA transfer family protein [Alphaproteobacteria bacterium]|jgi:type IV secretion system protein VirD4|nr:type IV secretory system conjugative DNA transfer family protein [Alphaproteobacteria bacterium]